MQKLASKGIECLEDVAELEFDVESLVKILDNRIEMKNEKKVSVMEKTEDLPKLPKIRVPNFVGKPNEWDMFYELFMEIIHNREDLSMSAKFNYLKSALGGEARSMVSHLLIGSVDNYHTVWELLAKRYENKRKIFSEQLNRLIDLPLLNIDSAKHIKNFIDSINEAIHVIKLKSHLTNEVDIVFAHIILRKFSRDALQLYESHVKKTKEIQLLSDVLEFLEQRLSSVSSFKSEDKKLSTNFSSDKENCPICKVPGHKAVQCYEFKAMSPIERGEAARKAQLCTKCLKYTDFKRCSCDYLCTICKKPHNTMLHFPNENRENVNTCVTNDQALLATAIVKVKSKCGDYKTLRALIDNGSQCTIISEESAQILNLTRIKAITKISGVSAQKASTSKYKVGLCIKPLNNKKEPFNIDAIVLPKLMRALPIKAVQVKKSKWRSYILADPKFDRPNRIDIIIGADLYAQIMKNGVVKIDGLLGQNTEFGWVVSGNTKSKGNAVIAATIIKINDLERFSKREDKDAEICKKHLRDTTRKDKSGRSMVKIPFKKETKLENSKAQALERFYNLKRLQQEQKKQQKLEKKIVGDNNNFSPAKKQQEGEQQVASNTSAKAKEEVSPKEALQKLTDVKKSDYLLSSSMWMLTEERKNELPKQRDSKLEELDISNVSVENYHKALSSNANALKKDGTEWRFIPPAGPHFGGICKAGVELMQNNFKSLTHENEAVLSSQPLCTTGHLLIGRPKLKVIVSKADEKIGILDRWKLIQKLKREFWVKLKEDYLHTLQQRNKWKRESENNAEKEKVTRNRPNVPNIGVMLMLMLFCQLSNATSLGNVKNNWVIETSIVQLRYI